MDGHFLNRARVSEPRAAEGTDLSWQRSGRNPGRQNRKNEEEKTHWPPSDTNYVID